MNIEHRNRWQHFKLIYGKTSHQQGTNRDDAEWFWLKSVSLGNAQLDKRGIERADDHIGVPVKWEPPSVFDSVTAAQLKAAQTAFAAGMWREDSQCENWVGIPIAGALGLDHSDVRDKKKISAILKKWIENKMFKVVELPGPQRKIKRHIVVDRKAENMGPDVQEEIVF